MKTQLEANFDQARAEYLSQVAWMYQKNLADAERKGGVDHLRANPALEESKRFLGIERRLIALAAYDDAAMEYIEQVSDLLETQFETIHRINAELRRLKRDEKPPLEAAEVLSFRHYLQLMLLASPIPKKIGSLIDYREGRRQASRTYAATTQPHLF